MPVATWPRNSLSDNVLEAFAILVLYDVFIDLTDPSLVLWKIFNNVDPKRDIIKRESRIVIDATKKGLEDEHLRPWPDDIVMAPAIIQRVEQRAAELGIEACLLNQSMMDRSPADVIIIPEN